MNSTTTTTPPSSQSLSSEALILIPLYATIFLLSVVGNSLVMVTLLQHKRMRTPMNVLLLNLAISDILLGVFCMPFTLTGFLLRNFIFGAFLCKVIPYLQAVSVTVSAYTLVMISFERFFGICYPLKTRHWRSLSHAYKMIAAVWVASFLLTIPVAVTSKLMPLKDSDRYKCREEWPSELSERIFNIYLNVLLLVIPSCLMTVLYISISKAMWQLIVNEREPENHQSTKKSETVVLLLSPMKNRRTKHKRNSRHSPKEANSLVDNLMPEPSNTDLSHDDDIVMDENTDGFDSPCPSFPSTLRDESPGESPSRKKYCVERGFLRKSNMKKSLENKKRIIKMLFVVVFEFFICWTPLHVINTVSLFHPRAIYSTLGMGGISALQLLAYCSACCNPITYCFMNASFRRAFLSAVRCKTDKIPFQSTEIQVLSCKTSPFLDKVSSRD